MNYIAAAVTDIGIRKSTNQDSFRVKIMNVNGERLAFAVLCDGMGGLSKGELASASLVDAFHRWSMERLPLIYPDLIMDSKIREEWVDIVTEYNSKIKTYAASIGISMGTTVTVLLLTPNRYYVMNVGDTRCYEIADGIKVITKDQTVVAREVEKGNLTPEEAERDPRRSVLLQCVGASETVYPDMFFGKPRSNAVYMLCSDGFRHMISENEIFQNLHPNCMTSMEGMTENMQRLVQTNIQRQETDNITVVSVRVY